MRNLQIHDRTRLVPCLPSSQSSCRHPLASVAHSPPAADPFAREAIGSVAVGEASIAGSGMEGLREGTAEVGPCGAAAPRRREGPDGGRCRANPQAPTARSTAGSPGTRLLSPGAAAPRRSRRRQGGSRRRAGPGERGAPVSGAKPPRHSARARGGPYPGPVAEREEDPIPVAACAAEHLVPRGERGGSTTGRCRQPRKGRETMCAGWPALAGTNCVSLVSARTDSRH